MDWFLELLWKDTIAHTILVYSFVIAVGVALGKFKVFGVSLGITFVLFVGILAGHLGFAINHEILDFSKDFGLILFIFSIGLQVGPGFFSSFKKGGLTFNLLAVGIVALGILMTIGVHFWGKVPISMAVGIMSGAVTNTPGLGAAQEALKQVQSLHPAMEIPQIGLGYAVAYPFGVLGIIFSMVLVRFLFKVSLSDELEAITKSQHSEETLPVRVNLKVKNPQLYGKKIKDIISTVNAAMVISRISHNDEISVTSSDTILQEGDILLVIAPKNDIEKIKMLIGDETDQDIEKLPSKLISRIVIVTKEEVIGKKLGSLKIRSTYGINITRITRAGIEFLANHGIDLQLGDKLTVVGAEEAVNKVAELLGNSMKRLDQPNIVPIFIGILVGVIFGSIPFAVPGIPMPLKLGLAGGPLIVAILLSKYGYKFKLISYTTHSANLMLREVGIVLFLASVGISAGGNFVKTVVSEEGIIWMAYGALITFVPLIIIGLIARVFLKHNYFEICGLLAGSTTDPPALAYANSIANNDAPSVTYATIYPLVMFLRVIGAQLLILIFS